MKALTIHQPWASLIALGAKKIETRGWDTSYRGPLAIHAGKRFDASLKDICITEPFFSVLRQAGLAGQGSPVVGWWLSRNIPLGCVVATCELLHVKQISDAISFPACREFWWQKRCWHLDKRERAFGNFETGRYMWLLGNVVALPEPIPAKGAQGLWNWGD